MNIVHSNWRDCQEWRALGLPMSTSSDEACKLYDAALTQYVGWYDDPSVGSLKNCVTKLTSTDPGFVMGQVISHGLDLMGTARNPRRDPDFRAAIDWLVKMGESATLIEREKRHVEAIKVCADGYMAEACEIWEAILVKHPTDMLALKFAHDSYFYLGYQPQMRDSIARVLPHWSADMPLYGFLKGMYSFGLCETNMFEKAEKVAREGLLLNRSDAWSTHSLAHVFEMQGRYKEGIAFLSSTVQDWKPCGMLACHIFWHWAVFHLEKCDDLEALDIFETQVMPRVKSSGAMLDIVDACSLLFRLWMSGLYGDGRKEQWTQLYEICRPHMDDHILVFNDVHFVMACIRSKIELNQHLLFKFKVEFEKRNYLMSSLKTFISEGKGTNWSVTKEVGLKLCEAFVAFSEADSAAAVNILLPLRYKVVKIGGSNAQRDVFSQFLIVAALSSGNAEHHKLARQLLVERKALKEDSPLTDRLISRADAVLREDTLRAELTSSDRSTPPEGRDCAL